MSKISVNNQDFPFQIGRLIANLRDSGASISGELLAGLPYPQGNALDTINEALPPRDYIAEAVEAVRNGEDPDPILALAGASDRRHEVGKVIADEANREYVDHLNASADDIIRSLRSDVFEPIVELLRNFHDEHGEQCDLQAAVKAGDFELAGAIQACDEAVGSIMSLHEMRRLLHSSSGGVKGEGNLFEDSAAWMLEPEAFDEVGAASKLDARRVPNMHQTKWWLQMIGGGYTPHYPTYREWQRLRTSQDFADYRETQRPSGGPAFSGGLRMKPER